MEPTPCDPPLENANSEGYYDEWDLIKKYEAALNAIIERSNTDEFGTSKVNDMRRIAEDALARKD